MEVRYTDHALRRMSERCIPKKELRRALVHGRRKTHGPDQLARVIYRVGDRVLVVV